MADAPNEGPGGCIAWETCTHDVGEANVALGYSQATLAAVKLALEFRGLAQPTQMLDVIARLVRDVAVDTGDTEPTRLLVEAIKIERLP